jgi:peptidoglycan/xylan/chitin deacetylase (PgdA/CDA1 family)
VQCWDDGVTADVRLTQILRRHGARATFNLNAGLYEKQRQPAFPGWTHKGTEVWRLGWDEVKDVYDGFTIGNHSHTHPPLLRIPIEAARRDIVDGRKRLQDFFGQPVLGFAYPCGNYNDAVMDAVREAGHVYARTTRYVEQCFPPENSMAFHSTCHFLAPDFWSRYEKARKCGVFYFWGHAYEIMTEPMWTAFEELIERISADPNARWGEVADLFHT